VPSALHGAGAPVNMEAAFSQLTLDVIGKALFNYDFNSLTTDSPLIQVGGQGTAALLVCCTALCCLCCCVHTGVGGGQPEQRGVGHPGGVQGTVALLCAAACGSV